MSADSAPPDPSKRSRRSPFFRSTESGSLTLTLLGFACFTGLIAGGTCGSDCDAAVCGDDEQTSNAADGEQCDGEDLAGKTCEDFGFDSGTLACASDCLAFDTSGCVGPGACGNGAIDAGETCDGSAHGTATCVTLGFASGNLACAADCVSFNTSACVPITDPCGNGALDTGEVCDGMNFDGETCASQGFTSGNLACAANCGALVTTSCVSGVGPRLFVTSENSSDPGTIKVFAIDAEDPATPLRTFGGSTLANPGQMATQGGELFVLDTGAGLSAAVHVFDVDALEGAGPTRTLSGAATTLDNPQGIAIVGSEMFIGHSAGIAVFPITASLDTAPTRTITSVGGTTLSYVSHLATTSTPNEIMLTTPNGDGLLGFLTTGGDTPAATRTLTPGISSAIAVVDAGPELFVSYGGSSGALMGLNDDLIGAVQRTITGTMTGLARPNGIAVSGTEIFVASTESGEIFVFDLVDDGDVMPNRTITLPNTVTLEPPNPRSVLVTLAP